MQIKYLSLLDVIAGYWEEFSFHLNNCFGVIRNCSFQLLVEQVNLIIFRTLPGIVVTEAFLTQSSTAYSYNQVAKHSRNLLHHGYSSLTVQGVLNQTQQIRA